MSATPALISAGGELAEKYGVSLEDQVELVHQLNINERWGFVESDFPAIPDDSSRLPSEQLLLSAYLPPAHGMSGPERTLLSLWRSVASPQGIVEKSETINFDTHSDYLRVIGGVWNPGLRWVYFDPSAFYGVPSNHALIEAIASGRDLAGTEVLMAAHLFPGWVRDFTLSTTPRPLLGGLRLLSSGRWASVPLFAKSVHQRKFSLGTYGASSHPDRCSVPTVRQI